jgi:hypothetical protein
MIQVIFYSILLPCLFFSTGLHAQNPNSLNTYKPGGVQDVVIDSLDITGNLIFGMRQGSVVINKEGRIDGVIEFMATPISPDPVQIEGYRVQIFFDKDIDKSRDIRSSFMSSYPKVNAYMVWSAPNHYVRVGNFRTEIQAMKFKEYIKDHYPETTIIKEKIDLPDLELELEGFKKD